MATTKLGILIETLYKGKGVDKAEKDLKGLDKTAGKTSGKLDMLKGGFAGIAAGAATVGVALFAAKKAFDFGKEGAQLAKVRNTFDLLTASIGETSSALLNDLREATAGMVEDTTLMESTSRFLSMGLATTGDEASKLATVAVTLGSAMGKEAGPAMEEFALLLANQSIPRLDTFGISAGKVKNRIRELRDENEGMTRETAFMTAVMEEAETSMTRLGNEIPVDDFTRFETNVTNLTDNLKILASEGLGPIVQELANVSTEFLTTTDMYAELDRAVKLGIISNEQFKESIRDFGPGIETEREALEALLEEVNAVKQAQIAAGDAQVSWDKKLQNYIVTADAAIEVTEELTTAHGGYFAEVIKSKEFTEDLRWSLWGAVEAADADAAMMAELAGELGLYSDAVIAAALETAIIDRKIQELAGKFVEGSITAGEMRGEVHALQMQLEEVQGEYDAHLDVKVSGLNKLREARALLGGGTSIDVPLHEQPGDPSNRVQPGGGGTTTTTTTGGRTGGPSEFQHGGSFMVPANIGRGGMLMRVHGGEAVSVTPAHQVNNNQSVVINTGANISDIERALARAGIKSNAQSRTM